MCMIVLTGLIFSLSNSDVSGSTRRLFADLLLVGVVVGCETLTHATSCSHSGLISVNIVSLPEEVHNANI